MERDRPLPSRRSIRLPSFDYAQDGAFFVTVVTDRRVCLFGDVVNGEMALNPLGQIVHEEWVRSAEIRLSLALDAFIVMPNHVHGVLTFLGGMPQQGSPADENNRLHRPPQSLSSFVSGFKGAVTSRIKRVRDTPDLRVWQRNYYEHVIRNDTDLARIREYIVNNPTKWDEDAENPNRGVR